MLEGHRGFIPVGVQVSPRPQVSGRLAQLEERIVYTDEAVGSSPTSPTA